MLGNILKSALDLVLPPLCLSCRRIVSENGTLCAQCWQQITFLAPPFCAACGQPFDHEMEPGALCALCIGEPYPFRRARSVFLYDEATRSMVVRFKQADRLETAPAFAQWMARAGADVIHPDAVIVPVPLHRWKLWSRRYNQAAVLALALGKITGLKVNTQALVRSRKTELQGRLGRVERARNVKGAFKVEQRFLPQIKDRTILLVDDVMTTGITVAECSQSLIKAGAKAVDVLTLGRVVR